MTPLFRETITILNRRVGLDSPDGLDAWKKTVLRGCVWVKTATRSPSGRYGTSVDVSLGQSVTVRIPESPEYRHYDQWKSDLRGFTASAGDIVVHGEVSEEITADNVQSVVAQYEHMTVSSVRDNSGLPLGHYHLEGV